MLFEVTWEQVMIEKWFEDIKLFSECYKFLHMQRLEESVVLDKYR